THYAIGETQITASLEGYQPAQMSLSIAGPGPASVVINQIPGIIEANNFESKSIVISLVDHSGKPVAAQEDTTVYLTSSDPEIARVQASTTIAAGQSHVAAFAYATQRAGVTTLTGAADGLSSGSTAFKTVGFTGSISEYHLGLYTMPKLPADGKSYDAVAVQLQDQSGLPVLAKTDTRVSLSSGSLVAGDIQESIVIPEGSSLVMASFKTSLIADDSFRITASSEGFTSVEVELRTTSQPLTILKSSDFPVRAEFGTEIPVSVDVYSGGLPVQNATVTVTGASARDNVVLTDENGHADGKYTATLPGSNTIIIKVNKPGYEERSISSRIILQHTVDVTINAETQEGAVAPIQIKVSPPVGVKVQIPKPGSPIIYDNVNWGQYNL
ncbi:MAG TPA: hypothetical protein VJ742_02240, partial [Nitrososphaera sp.]|nr:hypothetical protein [Nitrososphaera sp.]